ncbi:MAG: hypothetical protein L3J72_05195, partial [Thermoplasmata archaeon]|nr:hypothetical protein [Thermoplasmata archaeon]
MTGQESAAERATSRSMLISESLNWLAILASPDAYEVVQQHRGKLAARQLASEAISGVCEALAAFGRDPT